MSSNYVSDIIDTRAEESNTPSIGIFEYLYVIMLMLYAGRSTNFFESISLTRNPIGVFLPVIFSSILAVKWKLFFSPRFYALLFGFAIYFLAVSIKFYVILPTFLISYYFYFFVSYTAVRALKYDLFRIFEKLLYYAAIISLIFWGMQVLLGGDTLFNVFARSSYLRSIATVSGEGINAFIYTIQPYSTTLINEHTISRNCGFAWEPGSYASYLCLGIFINLFMSQNDKNRKKRFWILLAAVFSTMSTTGYVIVALIMVFYVINRDFKRILILLPVALAALILLFSLPFMKDKIVKLIEETSSIDQIVSDSFARTNPTTPQRFSSLMIAFVDFKANPILGLASHSEESWTNKLGSRVSPISGIGNLLAQFGIVGFLFFIVLSLGSSILFSRYFNYKGKLLLFLIIIGIAVSYTIIFIPFFMCFWMFSFFETDALTQKETSDEVVVPEEDQNLNNQQII